MQDAATGSTVGNSFDIAVYLQRTYPNTGAGDLFPTQTLDCAFTQNVEFVAPLSERLKGDFAEYARFNPVVDAPFSPTFRSWFKACPLITSPLS